MSVNSPSFSQSRAISSLASLYIFRMLGLFMVLPVIALSGDDYTGSNTALLGIALGIYGLTQALLQIPFGLLSDRFGRKPLIFLGLILFALGSVIAALADSVMGLIIGRALQGAGAIAGVIMAMVGDLTSVENRTKAMASIGASIGLAFAIALVLGPFIASLDIAGITGIRLLFWTAVLLSVVGVAVLLWLIPSTEGLQQKTGQLSFDQLRRVAKTPACLPLYLGVFVLHYVLMAVFVVVPVLLEQAGVLRDSHAWIYLAVMALSFVVMVPLIIIGEKKRKVKLLIRAAIIVLIAALGLVLSSQALWMIIVVLGLFFIAFNYLEASLPSLLSKLLPADAKGAGSGIFASCQFLGAALGGIAGGSLYDAGGLVPVAAACIVLLLLWYWVAKSLRIPEPASKNMVG